MLSTSNKSFRCSPSKEHYRSRNVLVTIHCIAWFSLTAIAQQDRTVADNSLEWNEEYVLKSDDRQNPSIFDQQTLLGSVFGMRTVSNPFGIEFGATVKNELWQNTLGGINKHSSYLFNIDVTASIDLQEAVSWDDASMFVHFLGNNGNSISKSVGDAQMISNIEAYRTGKLYQCWLQQNFIDGKLSLLAGIFDLNSEFYVTQTSGLFLNGSHGVGTDLGQTGNNGPSVFPNAALAFRAAYAVTGNLYTQFAVFDGMPGDSRDPSKFGISLSSADGYFAIAEFGLENENGNKVGIGFWKYSGTFSDLCSEFNPSLEIQRTDNYGGYILIDQRVYQNPLSETEGIRGFARFGLANGHVNSFDFHLGGGIVYSGFSASHEEDQLGYAVAFAHAGKDYRSYVHVAERTATSMEISQELTYRMKFAEWFFVQYDVQYVVHPSANPSIANALVGGVRLEVSL